MYFLDKQIIYPNALSASFIPRAIDENYIRTSKEASRFGDVGKIFTSLGKLH
jgi:hypothetical protein